MADTASVRVTDHFYLARQPILGRDQHLFAYELLFRHADEPAVDVTDQAAATAAVISHASQLGMQHVLGGRLAFLNVDEIVLMSDFIRFLPPDKVILEILETVKATPRLIDRVVELKKNGFRFALDDVVCDAGDVRQLKSLVDVIKVDIKATGRERLPQLVKSLRGEGQKLLAEKVETPEEAELCMRLGFDYFQGYYFARPSVLTGQKIAPSELALLHLIELIGSNADKQEIESSAGEEPQIRANLLRLLNSPMVEHRGKIESLSQALETLGPRQLGRWLQILLYSKPGAPVDLHSPLLLTAAARGKRMELMMERLRPKDQAAIASAFTVGILSLMDAMFSMSIAEVLGNLDLPDEVRDALLERKGDLGTMLRIVETIEIDHFRTDEFGQLLRKVGLTPADLTEIEIEAITWSDELALAA
ncbi:EAL and HDOD domain-containing protein [Pseudoduganella sp. GCM10020061]|uniref:EAL and HDOD domain-containing protein n=1 Tax=Pseudoduganella sp. GCM10020061 TaxID=3317345 RepID=UPI0036433E53